MKITKGGGLYIALTLLIGFAAVNTGNNILYLTVAAMLGFMAVSGFLGWSNIRGLSIKVILPEEVYSGHNTLASIHVINSKRLMPSFLLRVILSDACLDINFLERGGNETDFVPLAFNRRGRQEIAHVRVCSNFPVNFFMRCNSLPINSQFVVFPAPMDILGRGLSGTPVRGDSSAYSGKGFEGEVEKIIDYSGGYPLKLIHWRLSAKHEELKVKEMGDVMNEPVIVDPRLLPGHSLETRLSQAVFIVNNLIRSNRPVGLKTAGGAVIAPAVSVSHRLKLLTELALYDQN